MSPPNVRNGGPPAGPAAEIAATKTFDHQQGSRSGGGRTLLAVAEFHPPIGRRRLGVLLVRRCPSATCGRLHLHRAGSADSAHMATRTGSCGAMYVLNVHAALPIGGAA
jgi:hypothetical protein